MDKEAQKVELMRNGIEHRKACQICTDRVICDDMAEINLNLLKLLITG